MKETEFNHSVFFLLILNFYLFEMLIEDSVFRYGTIDPSAKSKLMKRIKKAAKGITNKIVITTNLNKVGINDSAIDSANFRCNEQAINNDTIIFEIDIATI